MAHSLLTDFRFRILILVSIDVSDIERRLSEHVSDMDKLILLVVDFDTFSEKSLNEVQ